MKQRSVRLPFFALAPLAPGLVSRASVTGATASMGRAVTVAVATDGTSPFTYQRRKDGATVTGAAGATCVIPVPGSPLAENRGTRSAPNAPEVESAATQVGVAFPRAHGDEDCALLVTLDPGVYPCRVTDAVGLTGIALLEAYEVSTAPTP